MTRQVFVLLFATDMEHRDLMSISGVIDAPTTQLAADEVGQLQKKVTSLCTFIDSTYAPSGESFTLQKAVTYRTLIK
jgi:hypothetical protein